MARPKVVMTDDLRTLLRLARTRCDLTQAQAAGKSGISEVWWSQLETGIADKVLLDTLVTMLITVKAPENALRKIDQDIVADAMLRQLDWFGSEAGL